MQSITVRLRAVPPGAWQDTYALKGARYDLLKHPAWLKPKEARRLELAPPLPTRI